MGFAYALLLLIEKANCFCCVFWTLIFYTERYAFAFRLAALKWYRRVFNL